MIFHLELQHTRPSLSYCQNKKPNKLSHEDKKLPAGLDADVDDGEIVTATGVSGSRKSTLPDTMIGDLDPAFHATGELWLNESRRDTLTVQARRIGILFQYDLLFPRLSVGRSLAYALPTRLSTDASATVPQEGLRIEIGDWPLQHV